VLERELKKEVKGKKTREELRKSNNQRGKKVKFSRYRPGGAQRVGRDIALLFHGRGTRRG